MIVLHEIGQVLGGAWKHESNSNELEKMGNYLKRKICKMVARAAIFGPTAYAVLFVAIPSFTAMAGGPIISTAPIAFTAVVFISILSSSVLAVLPIYKIIQNIVSLVSRYDPNLPYHVPGIRFNKSYFSFKNLHILATITLVANLILLGVAGHIVAAVVIGVGAAALSYLLYKIATTDFSTWFKLSEKTVDLKKQDDAAIIKLITDPNQERTLPSLTAQENLNLDLSYSPISDDILNTLIKHLLKYSHKNEGHKINLTGCSKISKNGLEKLLSGFPLLELKLVGTSLKILEIDSLKKTYTSSKFIEETECKVTINGKEEDLSKKAFKFADFQKPVPAQWLIPRFPYFTNLIGDLGVEGEISFPPEFHKDFPRDILEAFFNYLPKNSLPDNFLRSLDRMQKLLKLNDSFEGGTEPHIIWNDFLKKQGVTAELNFVSGTLSVTIIDSTKCSFSWIESYFGKAIQSLTLHSLNIKDKNFFSSLQKFVKNHEGITVNLEAAHGGRENYLTLDDVFALHEEKARFSILQIRNDKHSSEQDALNQLIQSHPELTSLEIRDPFTANIQTLHNLTHLSIDLEPDISCPALGLLATNKTLKHVTITEKTSSPGYQATHDILSILKLLKNNSTLETLHYVPFSNIQGFAHLLEEVRQKDPQLKLLSENIKRYDYEKLLNACQPVKPDLHPGLKKLTYLAIHNGKWDLTQFPKLHTLKLAFRGPIQNTIDLFLSNFLHIKVLEGDYTLNVATVINFLPYLPSLEILKRDESWSPQEKERILQINPRLKFEVI